MTPGVARGPRYEGRRGPIEPEPGRGWVSVRGKTWFSPNPERVALNRHPSLRPIDGIQAGEAFVALIVDRLEPQKERPHA